MSKQSGTGEDKRLSTLKLPSKLVKKPSEIKRRVSFGNANELITYKCKDQSNVISFTSRTVPLNDLKLSDLNDFTNDKENNAIADKGLKKAVLENYKGINEAEFSEEELSTTMDITTNLEVRQENREARPATETSCENEGFSKRRYSLNFNENSLEFPSIELENFSQIREKFSNFLKSADLDIENRQVENDYQIEKNKSPNTTKCEYPNETLNLVNNEESEKDSKTESYTKQTLRYAPPSGKTIGTSPQSSFPDTEKITLAELFSMAHVSFESARLSLGGSPLSKRRSFEPQKAVGKIEKLRLKLTFEYLDKTASDVLKKKTNVIERLRKKCIEETVETKRRISDNQSQVLQYAAGAKASQEELIKFQKAFSSLNASIIARTANEIVSLENETNEEVADVLVAKRRELEKIKIDIERHRSAQFRELLSLRNTKNQRQKNSRPINPEKINKITANKAKIDTLEKELAKLSKIDKEENRKTGARKVEELYRFHCVCSGVVPVRCDTKVFQAKLGRGNFLFTVRYKAGLEAERKRFGPKNSRGEGLESEFDSVDIKWLGKPLPPRVREENSISSKCTEKSKKAKFDKNGPLSECSDGETEIPEESKVTEKGQKFQSEEKDYVKRRNCISKQNLNVEKRRESDKEYEAEKSLTVKGQIGVSGLRFNGVERTKSMLRNFEESLFGLFEWESIFREFNKKDQLPVLVSKSARICHEIVSLRRQLEELFLQSVFCGKPLLFGVKDSYFQSEPGFGGSPFIYFWIINEQDRQAHFWLNLAAVLGTWLDSEASRGYSTRHCKTLCRFSDVDTGVTPAEVMSQVVKESSLGQEGLLWRVLARVFSLCGLDLKGLPLLRNRLVL